MELKKIEIEKLNPAEYNPRKDLTPEDDEYQKIKRSIEEFGYISPLVINSDNTVISGHQRLKVLKDLGYESIEAIVVEIDKTKEKAVNIALNKISGEWDRQKLADLLLELDTGAFDLELTGFDMDEIEKMMTEFYPEESEEDDFDPDEELEKIEEAKTKVGDIWLLDSHRLLCGDATDITQVSRLMGDKTADLVITDPPYNVDYEGFDGKKIKGDKQEDKAFYQFLFDAFQNMNAYTKEGGPIYIFHADSEGINFRTAMVDSGWLMKQALIWVKNTFVMGRQDYHWQHEPILYGWKKGASHAWYGFRDKSTVVDKRIDIKDLKKSELLEFTRELLQTIDGTVIELDKPKKNELHPTMKPIELIGYLIQNSSLTEEIVLDLFMGSGSTLIAADQLRRYCFGAEIDPAYCDVIVKRYIDYKGSDKNIRVLREGKEIHYRDL